MVRFCLVLWLALHTISIILNCGADYSKTNYLLHFTDIPALKHVCNNIIKVLSKQSPLHKESALCSRFLYKYDQKFRNDIGYRNLKKVHTALKKYLALNLLKDIESFLLALPSETDDEKYLPTRQMLEYVMLRIITFSMIMLRICVCSKQAAILYLNRVKRSESHWMSLLPYALMSRLWSMTMVLVQHSTSWYSNLYPYLNKLELKGLPFLPDHYELTKDLEAWLDLKNVDNFGRFEWEQRKIFVEAKSLLDDDDENDLFDNILNFVNQTNVDATGEELEEEVKSVDASQDLLSHTESSVVKVDQGELLSRENYKTDRGTVVSRERFNTDYGQSLSRDSVKYLLNTQKNNSKVNNQDTGDKYKPLKQNKGQPKTVEDNEHSYKKVTNATSLQEFIDNEETYRNKNDSRSLTDHLSLMQWHALKNASLKLCDALTNRKIERKFQKIWQQKCLDYK